MSAYTHLLTLTDLHVAAPSVLDVVFGPDGDYDGAPPWAGPLTGLADPARHGWLVWHGALHVSVATHDGHWSSTVEQWRERWALDLRIPSVAARLAGLCARTPVTEEDDGVTRITRRSVLKQAMIEVASGTMRPGTARALAALTLTLAPQIAALKAA